MKLNSETKTTPHASLISYLFLKSHHIHSFPLCLSSYIPAPLSFVWQEEDLPWNWHSILRLHPSNWHTDSDLIPTSLTHHPSSLHSLPIISHPSMPSTTNLSTTVSLCGLLLVNSVLWIKEVPQWVMVRVGLMKLGTRAKFKKLEAAEVGISWLLVPSMWQIWKGWSLILESFNHFVPVSNQNWILTNP